MQTKKVAIDQIKIGDLILLKPGEKIATMEWWLRANHGSMKQ